MTRLQPAGQSTRQGSIAKPNKMLALRIGGGDIDLMVSCTYWYLPMLARETRNAKCTRQEIDEWYHRARRTEISSKAVGYCGALPPLWTAFMSFRLLS